MKPCLPKFFFTLAVLSLFWMSCSEETKLEKAIAKIEVKFKVERFDSLFKAAKPNDLPQLKTDYPFLFPKRVADSVWLRKMTDTLQNEILDEVNKHFDDFTLFQEDIKRVFQHLKYYDQQWSLPRVITLTNDVDYRNPVYVSDTLVLIALDDFLGESHRFYQNFPKYIARNLKPSQIVQNIVKGYAERYAIQAKRSTFLDEMIYQGKLLYFQDKIAPFSKEEDRISYSADQLQWVQANEAPIWSYFVEKELLFSTDPKLVNRFIANAPYSKFYLELDNESPGRLGQYMGWQIVRAYAERTKESLMQIMQKDPETLFNISKYKPKK